MFLFVVIFPCRANRSQTEKEMENYSTNMKSDAKVIVELCRSNSIGSRFLPASIFEYHKTTKEEAKKLCEKDMESGFFWRIQPEDRTGN